MRARAGAGVAGGERGAAGPGCSTGFPRVPCVRAQVPAEQAESEVLLAETRAADALEAQYAADLDFGGIHTSQARR